MTTTTSRWGKEKEEGWGGEEEQQQEEETPLLFVANRVLRVSWRSLGSRRPPHDGMSD